MNDKEKSDQYNEYQKTLDNRCDKATIVAVKVMMKDGKTSGLGIEDFKAYLEKCDKK